VNTLQAEQYKSHGNTIQIQAVVIYLVDGVHSIDEVAIEELFEAA
jgi:hypothetical protein